MERLLLENFSLINKIKEEYDNIIRENKSLKEKIRELEGKKNVGLKEIILVKMEQMLLMNY